MAPEDLYITREQSIGLIHVHDMSMIRGLQICINYRAIPNTVSHLEACQCKRINTAKQKD